MLTLSKPRPKQPRHAASINWANPLGARILSAVFGGRNIVNGKSGVMSGATAFRGDAQGLMTSLDGASYLDLSAAGLFNDETKPVTICYYSKPMAAPTYAGVLRVATIAAPDEFVILRAAAGTGYEFAVGHAIGSVPVFAVPARTDGVAERVVVVASQGMLSATPAHYTVWINRVKYTSNSTVVYTAQPTNGTTYFGWDGPDSKWAGLLDELTIFSGAFSDADAASYFDNPWQILTDIQPRLTVPAPPPSTWLAADVTTAGWTTTETSYRAAIDEATANDATYITSPPLTATAQVYSATFTTPRASGTWTHPTIRAKAISGTGAIRLRYLDAGNASVGVSPWQALTNTLANYSITVTTTATATQIQLEVTQ